MRANQNLQQLFLLVTFLFSLLWELKMTLKMDALLINQNDVNGKLILQEGMIVLSQVALHTLEAPLTLLKSPARQVKNRLRHVPIVQGH
jgi:hypothetical protein